MKDNVATLYPVKSRRITRQDWREVEKHLSTELERRKSSEFRKTHEEIWTEVDRQVAMKPMRRIVNGKEINDWHSTVELGELSKASEVITADVRRMLFPAARAWFDAHAEIPVGMGEDGQKQAVPGALQNFLDGSLRALMSQQHMDFGLKARIELSIKEALHHGSFVAEVKMATRQKVSDGSKIENLSAPAWVPHSMWNCYPDPSQYVVGTDMFYDGSMMIVSCMPFHLLKEMGKGDGWMNLDNIPGDKKKDAELVTYYGDLVIERADAKIMLPNCKAITANKRLIYYAPNDLPYVPVIYAGYERQDVRDPYYTSPIVKLSPMQKLGSVMVNKFIEAVALKTEPPIVYDGSDSYLVQTGGPVIAPGVKTPTKGAANWKEVEIGDPQWAMAGLNVSVEAIQSGTGVNAVRAGGPSSDRQTATEVIKTSQSGEIRTVDFVDKLESQGLRPFLYMQHALNRKYMPGYSFYNAEMDAPDFMRVNKDDLPDTVHFEVVGSKGLLGEEQRTQRTSAVTAFASGNPLFAPLLRPDVLLKEMYQDAGNKNPERFLSPQEQQDPRIAQMQQQMQQIVQQMQQKIQELESKQQVEMAKLQQSGQIEQAKAQQSAQIDQAEIELKARIADAELQLKREIAQAELQLKRDQAGADIDLKREQASGDIDLKRRVELTKLGQKDPDGDSDIETTLAHMLDQQANRIGAMVEEAITTPMPVEVERDASGRVSAVVKNGRRQPVIRSPQGQVEGLGAPDG